MTPRDYDIKKSHLDLSKICSTTFTLKSTPHIFKSQLDKSVILILILKITPVKKSPKTSLFLVAHPYISSISKVWLFLNFSKITKPLFTPTYHHNSYFRSRIIDFSPSDWHTPPSKSPRKAPKHKKRFQAPSF